MSTLRRIIAISAAIILFLTIMLCVSLKAPRFWAWSALYLLTQQSPAIMVRQITMDSVRWSWGKFIFKNVRIRCAINQIPYVFFAAHITVKNLNAFASKEPLFIDVENLSIASHGLNIPHINTMVRCYFHKLHYERAEIFSTSPLLQWEGLRLEDLKGNFADNGRQIKLLNVQGRCYGGDIVLSGWVQYLNPIFYGMHIQLNHINSLLLAEANPAFGQLKAKIEGVIQIQDLDGQGPLIESNLRSPQGGSIKASLLKYLAQYVPQRQQIESLIAQDKDVLLDDIQAKVISLAQDKLFSEVFLKSSSLNLNMKIKFNLHVEGGFKHLLKYIGKDH